MKTMALAVLATLALCSCDRTEETKPARPFDRTADMADRSADLTGAHRTRYRELTECRTRLWQLRKGETPFTRGAGDARIDATRNDGTEVALCQDELMRATR